MRCGLACRRWPAPWRRRRADRRSAPGRPADTSRRWCSSPRVAAALAISAASYQLAARHRSSTSCASANAEIEASTPLRLAAGSSRSRSPTASAELPAPTADSRDLRHPVRRRTRPVGDPRTQCRHHSTILEAMAAPTECWPALPWSWRAKSGRPAGDDAEHWFVSSPPEYVTTPLSSPGATRRFEQPRTDPYGCGSTSPRVRGEVDRFAIPVRRWFHASSLRMEIQLRSLRRSEAPPHPRSHAGRGSRVLRRGGEMCEWVGSAGRHPVVGSADANSAISTARGRGSRATRAPLVAGIYDSCLTLELGERIDHGIDHRAERRRSCHAF